jgi:hypothetical protein
MIDLGWCRTRVNKQVGRVRRAFKWAASQELVPAAVCQALVTVAGLQKGRTDAAEREPVGPAPAGDVAAALPFLWPTVRAMVELQLFSGMRPGEVRALRPRDVDRSCELWVYRPPGHKMAWQGKGRAVWIGPRAQAILGPLLEGVPGDRHVFSPVRAREERYAAARARRRCPVYPSSPAVGAQRKPADQLVKRTRGWFTDQGYAAEGERVAARVRPALEKAAVGTEALELVSRYERAQGAELARALTLYYALRAAGPTRAAEAVDGEAVD